MSAGLSDIQIINWALDAIPAQTIVTRQDASQSARLADRNYNIILSMCLRNRLVPWNFATSKIQLTATTDTPINEFSNSFTLPGNLIAIQRIWPTDAPYRKEGGILYTNATTVIVKYTNDRALLEPALMEYDFAQYFALSLAAQMAPTLSEDPNRREKLAQEAEIAFIHASAAFSMEDTPDEVPQGAWFDIHENLINISRRSDRLLDYDSIP